MTQHVIEWLPAYHDGELSQGRHSQVQQHLETCPGCRAELQALESLSAMLSTIPVPEMAPASRFAAQVQLRLPRRPAPAARPTTSSQPRWVLVTALVLVGSWSFLQAALFLTAIFFNAEWLFHLQGLNFPAGSGFLDLAGIAVSLLILNFALLVLTAIIWSLWLAFWWAWKNNQKLEAVPNRI